MSNYAWMITRDHLSEGDDNFTSEVGTQGPRNADLDLVRRLDAGEGKTFRMYDDDGELYYTGRQVVSDESAWDDEAVVAAPLDDFGAPGAGATLIRWNGHPEWEIG